MSNRNCSKNPPSTLSAIRDLRKELSQVSDMQKRIVKDLGNRLTKIDQQIEYLERAYYFELRDEFFDALIPRDQSFDSILNSLFKGLESEDLLEKVLGILRDKLRIVPYPIQLGSSIFSKDSDLSITWDLESKTLPFLEMRNAFTLLDGAIPDVCVEYQVVSPGWAFLEKNKRYSIHRKAVLRELETDKDVEISE